MAEKKYMIIDGIRAEFTDEKNILQVIHKVGIHVPTFCYYSDMSIYGACRMCVVEDERGGIIASCSTPPKNKMVIKTNTGRLHDYRKMILELLLASHCRDCTVCEKNGNCRLQMLAARFRLTDVRFPNTHPERMIDDSSLSIVRDPSKCILCGDCVRMCNEVRYKFYQLSFCLVLSQTLRQLQHEPLVQPVQQHAYSEHTKPAKLVLNLSLW